MKFGILWRESVDMLPSYLGKTSINYKNWKKISKKNSGPYVISLLNKRCKKIEQVFLSECKTTISSSCFRNSAYSIEDLLDFAILNKKSLYKICKRLDKRTKSHAAMCWLNQHGRCFQFIHGFWLTHLESSQYYTTHP